MDTTDRPQEMMNSLPTPGVSDHGPVSRESSGPPMATIDLPPPRSSHHAGPTPLTHADQSTSSPLPTPGPSPLLPTPITSEHTHTPRTIRQDTELAIDTTTRSRSPPSFHPSPSSLVPMLKMDPDRHRHRHVPSPFPFSHAVWRLVVACE